MLIIVEGPDGSGKSTLIKRIKSLPGLPQLWCLSSASRYRDQFLLGDFLGWLRQRPSDVRLLFDRFPLISECVYGPILRGSLWGRPLTDSAMSGRDMMIENHLKELDPEPLIIYTRVPIENLRESIQQEPQLDGVISQLDLIYAEYERMMTRLSTTFKVMLVDPFSPHSTDRCLNRLNTYMLEHL
jgi:hypothetical protein